MRMHDVIRRDIDEGVEAVQSLALLPREEHPVEIAVAGRKHDILVRRVETRAVRCEIEDLLVDSQVFQLVEEQPVQRRSVV